MECLQSVSIIGLKYMRTFDSYWSIKYELCLTHVSTSVEMRWEDRA
jgi:hypothetical protein